MKAFFVRAGIYLLLFPAVAIFTYLVSYLAWDANFVLIIGVGYITLILPALLTAAVDFGLSRVRLRQLIVTLFGMLVSLFVARLVGIGEMPSLNFYTAIASLTCCQVADLFQPKGSANA